MQRDLQRFEVVKLLVFALLLMPPKKTVLKFFALDMAAIVLLGMFSKSGSKSEQTKDVSYRPKINYGVGGLTLGRASWLNSS